MPKRDYDFSDHSLLNRYMGESVEEFNRRADVIIAQLRANVRFEERLLGYREGKRRRVDDDYVVIHVDPTNIASSSSPPVESVEPPEEPTAPPVDPIVEPENVNEVEGGDEGEAEVEEEEEEEEQIEENVGAPFPVLPPYLEIQATEYLSDNEEHNETIYEFKVREYYELSDESEDDADEVEDDFEQPSEDEGELDVPFPEDVQDESDPEEDLEFDLGDPWAEEEDPVEIEQGSDDESAIDYPEDAQPDEDSDSETEIVEISSDENDDDSSSNFDPYYDY